jgi:hypothetical protein
MSFKKIIRDPAFWSLIVFNAFVILMYQNDQTQFSTIIWIYWWQSIIIGIFNFMDMRSIPVENISIKNLKINNQPATPEQAKGCLPWFFLFHYGIFHFVYFIFLLVQYRTTYSYRFALLGMLINYGIYYYQNKKKYRHVVRNIGTMFFMPYLRVLPMHLAILAPQFLKITPALVFLVLKAVMDIIGHLLTTPYYWQNEKAPGEGTYT